MGCFGPGRSERVRYWASRDNVKETFVFDRNLTHKEYQAALDNIQDLSKHFECTVIAGEGKGPGKNQFNEPHCLFVDHDRWLYVTDRLNHRVERINLDNTETRETVAGGNGQGWDLNQLNKPTGVFVDIMGDIFIADFGNNRIMKWTAGAAEGQVVCQIQHPKSIYMGEDNSLYVSTLTYNGAVLKVNPYVMGMSVVRGGRKRAGTTNPIKKLRNKATKKTKEDDDSSSSSDSDSEDDDEPEFEDFLNVPEQVFVVGNEVVVANSNSNCISVIDQSGEFRNKEVKTLVQGNRKYVPSHFVMDQDMGVYCTDDVKQSITRHGIDGKIQILYKGNNEHSFNRGLALDETGAIYAINWGAYDFQIVKITQKQESSFGELGTPASDPFAAAHDFTDPNLLSPSMLRPIPIY